MRVGELTRQKPVQATVDLGDGDTIELVFDRNRVTPAWASVADKNDDKLMSPPAAIAAVTISWDVTNDDGSPFPPTADNIAVLSYPAQKALLRKIMEVAIPSDAEGKDSSGQPSMQSSDSRVPEPVHPNGLVTSPLPAHSASPSVT